MRAIPVVGVMAESYSADEYDYEDDDFEDDEHHEKSPTKRVGTPHSSKKSPQKQQWDAEDDQAENSGEIVDNLDVEGQDLESYMKQYSSENNNAANNEDLACELKPLEGVRPKLDNAEEEKLLHKLGYSYSNHSSPVKGSYQVRTDNSPSPSLNHGQGHKKSLADQWSSGPYDITISEGNGREEHPSTRTSKDTKNSPTPKPGDKSSNNGHKVGFSLAKHAGENESDEDHGFTSPGKHEPKKSKPAANYMDNFKNLLDHTESSPKDEGPSPVREPTAADLILLSKKQPTAGEERENAERVDALLMELFPERYEKKKQKAPKAGKKGNVGYSKNHTYGLAAPRAPASVEYLYSSSAANGSSNSNSYNAGDEDSAPMPLMQSLDQQLKLLKKELKAKDDKITRLTEHAVMMGHHMDKLKGEAAHLTVQLREANLELDAKEGRLQEALKQRKKAKKAAANGGGVSTNNGSSNDVAALENENARLRDREQALMDAIEELSNQNEDLIDKLKESMERELVLSSKRAAQISHNVSAIAEQAAHHQSYQYLPSIGAAGAGLRTQSQPDQSAAAVAGAKRTTRKKRA